MFVEAVKTGALSVQVVLHVAETTVRAEPRYGRRIFRTQK